MSRAPKRPNNVASAFFNTVYLLPKDLRFERGYAKLDSCLGRHLTSILPWFWFTASDKHLQIFAKIVIKFCLASLCMQTVVKNTNI